MLQRKDVTASERGYQGVPRLLLEWGGTNSNAADTRHNQTPLYWAGNGRYEVIVNLLLEREDFNSNTEDTELG